MNIPTVRLFFRFIGMPTTEFRWELCNQHQHLLIEFIQVLSLSCACRRLSYLWLAPLQVDRRKVRVTIMGTMLAKHHFFTFLGQVLPFLRISTSNKHFSTSAQAYASWQFPSQLVRFQWLPPQSQTSPLTRSAAAVKASSSHLCDQAVQVGIFQRAHPHETNTWGCPRLS